MAAMAAWRKMLLVAAALFCWAARPTQVLGITEYEKLSCIMDRLGEPIFLAKGTQRRVVIKIPAKFLRPRLQPLANQLAPGADETDMEVMELRDVPLPSLTPAMGLDRYDHFSPFIPSHRRMAKYLIEILLRVESFDEFLSMAAYCRERVNPFLFSYAMGVTIRHRADTRSMPTPSPACIFPQKYFNGGIFPLLNLESALPEGQRAPIVIPRQWTASDLDIEHRVAYFREDVGVNLAHWQWHLVYPFDGPRAVVNKDRRGELFYYFHEQILARYNFERLGNYMGRVTRFDNFRESIPEAYFPKLDNIIASRVWMPRMIDMRLQNIQRADLGLTFDIQDMERWRDRIFEAIHLRRVQTETGQFIPLDSVRGIDILGNVMESSLLSVNRNYYGDLHNLGHVAIGFVHDPDNRYLESGTVMGDTATALRDPVFYRWHAFVQDVFDEHKATLPRYSIQELGFDGVQVLSIGIQTMGLGRPNELRTLWQQRDIDISRGLDFAPRGPVYVRYTHLQHMPFIYNIQVRNSAAAPRDGTVRIFLAPQLDERRLPLALRDQRSLFMELDKFRVRLAPGVSSIVRWHNQSSVTIPSERTFRNLDARPPGAAGAEFDYCGCGWPQHLLIPRGAPDGLRGTLFIMVSNFEDDQVEQTIRPNACADGHSYCGILGQLFPDRRSMGFPFDRMPGPNVVTLQQFMTPNMQAVSVVIVNEDRTLAPGEGYN